MCRGHGEVAVGRGGEGEGAAFEAAQVEGEAVAHPGQDLEAVAPAIVKDEQVAALGVAVENGADDTGQPVDALAAIDGINGDENATAREEG